MITFEDIGQRVVSPCCDVEVVVVVDVVGA